MGPRKRKHADPRRRLLRSIHFLHPIPGPDGPVSVLYEDEATWSIQALGCQVGGGGQRGSQFDIKRAEPSPVQMLPVPHWLINYRTGPDDVVVLNVPINNAIIRAPMRLVGDGDEKQAIPARVWDEERRAAEASEEGSGDEGENKLRDDLSGLVTPGTGTRQ